MSSRIDNICSKCYSEHMKSICQYTHGETGGKFYICFDPDSGRLTDIRVNHHGQPVGCNLLRIVQEDVIYDMERFVEDYVEASREIL